MFRFNTSFKTLTTNDYSSYNHLLLKYVDVVTSPGSDAYIGFVFKRNNFFLD